jgi:hypothetical protein
MIALKNLDPVEGSGQGKDRDSPEAGLGGANLTGSDEAIEPRRTDEGRIIGYGNPLLQDAGSWIGPSFEPHSTPFRSLKNNALTTI